MASLEAEMLERIHIAIQQHNATCPMPARAVLMNPANFELFGWNEILGLPVEARDGVPPQRFRIDCSGSAYGVEDVVEQFVVEPVETDPVEADPLIVPSGPIRSPF